MEIIAKTQGGCLIQATEKEVQEILNAVTGKKPDELVIGQKIPAIDYASTITKVKSLSDDYDYKCLVERAASFAEALESLKQAIHKAGEITV